MKRSLLIIAGILFLSISKAQKTFEFIDIGGEYQPYSHGSIYNLQVALNTKLNHAVQIRLGYNNVPSYGTKTHTEEGGGWGGGLGYRYYFAGPPSKFFAGARIDAWSMDIDVDFGIAAGPAVYSDPVWVFHPAIETGYMFLINKKIFLTPYVTAGLHSDGYKDNLIEYTKGFKITGGISAGVRF
jgi:hypothetical protein